MKIDPGKENGVWQTHVVMSQVPREQLPSNLSQDGAKRLCDIESVLKDRGVDMKLKNRHWYNRKKSYLRAKFDVKVILGAADLKFQLQTKDNTVISKDHDEIHVRWELPKDGSTDAGHGLSSMYKGK